MSMDKTIEYSKEVFESTEKTPGGKSFGKLAILKVKHGKKKPKGMTVVDVSPYDKKATVTQFWKGKPVKEFQISKQKARKYF